MAPEQTEAEARLALLQEQLKDIERLKKMENSVRKEIAKLEEEVSAQQSEGKFFGKEEDVEVPVKSPVMCPKGSKSPQFGAAPVDTEAEKRTKRMKAINKKLGQIKQLTDSKPRDQMNDDEKAKVHSEAELLKELKVLEAGGDYAAPEPSDEALPPYEALPADPAEREKRVKALKKKLEGIKTLKASKNQGNNLDADATKKVESEHRLLQELAALEEGVKEVVYKEKDPAEAAAEEQQECDRKLKAVRKKLQQIEKLKEAGGTLDAEAAAKVASQKALQKEAHQLEEKLGALKRAERERVEAKLGWESQNGGKKGKK